MWSLGMKRTLWGAALAAAACMFFACGEGSIDGFSGDDDMALLNYGQFNPDGMKGLVNTAMAQCEEDPKCKEAMENAKDAPAPADTAAGSSSATDSSGTSASSSSAAPGSSTASISSSSATPVSSATATSSSSSAPRKEVVATKFVGTCSATSVVKGNPTTWKFVPTKTCITEAFCSLDPESYEWTFEGGDPETSTDAEPSVVYTEAKQYTAKVRLKNGDVDTTITCTPVTITGPEVTGCTCGEPELKSTSNKISGSQSTVQYEWTVSGCSSKDGKGNEETNFTYSWNGNGVSGNTETGTGSFTKLGFYSASVTVTNSDGNSKVVTCDKEAPVDDASWTFKCSPINSTLLTTELEGTDEQGKPKSNSNKADFNAVANKCYSYPMDKTTVSDYDPNINIGSWSGGTTKMYYMDCNGDEGSATSAKENFASVNVKYKRGTSCSIYFYTDSDLQNLLIMTW